MKYLVCILILTTTIFYSTKAHSGIVMKASTLLIKPVYSEFKVYNRLKKASKEYKKATYNLTVADIYYLDRIGFPNIQKMVNLALLSSFEAERKVLIKTIFKEKNDEKDNEVKICLNNINYDELKNHIKKDIENKKVDKKGRYIIEALIKALEMCMNYNFSNEEQIQLKRDIEYNIEQDLRK